MVSIISINADYFELNGVRYPTIYQPLKFGSLSLGIYNVYDTRQQLLSHTPYDEIAVDSIFYANVDDLIDALLPVIYKPVGVSSSVAWGSIIGNIVNQTDLQTALAGKAAVSHTHTISQVTGLQTALDGKAATSHTHTTSQITNLSSYTGLDSRYFTEGEIGDFFSGTTAITGYNRANWDIAFGWGDHSLVGYLTSFTEVDPVFTASPAAGITGTQITDWDTAFGWGDHNAAGYLTNGSIDTLLKLNSIVSDATLIDDAPIDGSEYVRQNGSWQVASGSVTPSLSDLTDTSILNPVSGHFIKYNGIAWANSSLVAADISDLVSYTGFDARYYTETEVDTILGDYVDKTSTDTISGVKVFTVAPILDEGTAFGATLGTADRKWLLTKYAGDQAVLALETGANTSVFNSLYEFNASGTPTNANDVVTLTFANSNYVDLANNQTVGGEKTFSGNFMKVNTRLGVATDVFGGARLGDSAFQATSVDLQTLNFKDSGQATALAMFFTALGGDGYVTTMKNFVDDVNVLSVNGVGAATYGGALREVEATIGLRNDFTAGQYRVFDTFNNDYDAATEVAEAQGWVAIHGGGATGKKIGLWRYDGTTYTNIFEVPTSNVMTFNVDTQFNDSIIAFANTGTADRKWQISKFGSDQISFAFETAASSGSYTSLYELNSTGTPSNANDLITKSYADANYVGGSPAWGDITGTLANQTDLQGALDNKANLASATFLDSTYVSASFYTELGVIRDITAVNHKLFLNVDATGDGYLGWTDSTNTAGLYLSNSRLDYYNGTTTVGVATLDKVYRTDQDSYADGGTGLRELGVIREVAATDKYTFLAVDVNGYGFFGRRDATPTTTAFALSDTKPMFYDGSTYKDIYYDGNLPASGGTPSVDIYPAIKSNPVLVDQFLASWVDWYANGTISLDTTDYMEGGSSLKIVTDTGTGLCGAYKDELFTGQDLTNASFRVWVKSDDWANITNLDLLVSTSGTFTSFYSYSLLQTMVNKPNGEWIELVFNTETSNWGASGTPDFSTPKDCIIRAISNTSTTPTVWVSGLQVIENITSKHVISITFDDNWDSDLTEGKKYMDRYGYRGTSFVIPDEIAGTNKLTEAELEAMNKAGWEIGAHGATNLTSFSEANLVTELEGIKSWFNARNFKGSNNLAYPNGGYNDLVLKYTSRYFNSARSIDGANQPMNNLPLMKVSAKTVANTDSVATLQGWIDEAIANEEYLIITFHRIVASGASVSTEYNRADFEDVIDYLNTQGARVLPYGEALEYCRTQVNINL